ncbi:hypothetical protein HHL28_15700 [Aerophototrophica crusticola]|uniref:DUF6079 domain-containing protein n=1 Tax=Aerophototrophica crusticola TaxID=1709002 RepID=A0A858RBI5_9PROT|nr:hypothetical protein HHL28_15700 [Rhodospirillaceae bacterium B3]
MLAAQELEHTATCPHCQFRPAQDALFGRDMARALSTLENRLHGLGDTWTQSLRAELARPQAQEGLALLSAAERRMVEDFLEDGALPEPVEDDFVAALRAALQSLRPVTLEEASLLAALPGDGAPTTVKDLRDRFNTDLRTLLGSHTEAEVRVTFQDGAKGYGDGAPTPPPCPPSPRRAASRRCPASCQTSSRTGRG